MRSRVIVLPALGITQARMAELLGVSRVTLAQLLHEHRALSGDMALRQGKLPGTSAESWLNMQQALDLWEARQDVQRFAHVTRYRNSQTAMAA
ncbi:MAG: HigA family addiction module antitoxin [Rhodoferax sp.]|uniref:HigA family addiction module antitoxin n=1 Tax=Rhodoferax sp. TaxID=50421 RepID=UPI003BB623F7